MPVVANSSPLIYLAALSDFHFLRNLFGPIAIQPAVYHTRKWSSTEPAFRFRARLRRRWMIGL